MMGEVWLDCFRLLQKFLSAWNTLSRTPGYRVWHYIQTCCLVFSIGNWNYLHIYMDYQLLKGFLKNQQQKAEKAGSLTPRIRKWVLNVKICVFKWQVIDYWVVWMDCVTDEEWLFCISVLELGKMIFWKMSFTRHSLDQSSR